METEALIELVLAAKRKRYEKDMQYLLKDAQDLDEIKNMSTKTEEDIFEKVRQHWELAPLAWTRTPSYYVNYKYEWNGERMDVRQSSADLFLGFQNDGPETVTVQWTIKNKTIVREIPPHGKLTAWEKSFLWLTLCMTEPVFIEPSAQTSISLLYAWIPNNRQHYQQYWTFHHENDIFVYQKGELFLVKKHENDGLWLENGVKICKNQLKFL